MRTYKGITVHTVKDGYVRDSLDIIDQYLRQVDSGFKRIQQGLPPSVNGGNTPPADLANYFYLPGTSGGQLAYGGTLVTDVMRLVSSTSGSVPARISVEDGDVQFDAASGGGTVITTVGVTAGTAAITIVDNTSTYAGGTATPSLLNILSHYTPGANGGYLAKFSFGNSNVNSADQPLWISTDYNGQLFMCGNSGSGFVGTFRRKPSLGGSSNPNITFASQETGSSNSFLRLNPKSVGSYNCAVVSGNSNITLAAGGVFNPVPPVGSAVYGAGILPGTVVTSNSPTSVMTVSPVPDATNANTSLLFGQAGNHLELTYYGTATAGIVFDPTFGMRFYAGTSAKYVTLRAPRTITPTSGNGYDIILPTAPGAANTVLLNDGASNTSWATLAALGGAANTEAFVTIGNTAGLTSERALTGTANQITVTDNGAGSTVVLATPQNLHTASTFQVGTLGVGAAASGGNYLDVTGGPSVFRDALTVSQGGTGDGLIIHYNSNIMAGTPFKLIDDGLNTADVYIDTSGNLRTSALSLKISTWLLTFQQSAQTADRVITFPNLTGTVQLLSGTQTSSAIMTWTGSQIFSNASITITAGLSTAYATGSFVVATAKSKILINHLILTTTQRAQLSGTSRLRLE